MMNFAISKVIKMVEIKIRDTDEGIIVEEINGVKVRPSPRNPFPATSAQRFGKPLK